MGLHIGQALHQRGRELDAGEVRESTDGGALFVHRDHAHHQPRAYGFVEQLRALHQDHLGASPGTRGQEALELRVVAARNSFQHGIDREWRGKGEPGGDANIASSREPLGPSG